MTDFREVAREQLELLAEQETTKPKLVPVADVRTPKAVPTIDNPIVWKRLSEIPMRPIVFVDKPLLQADAFHLVAARKGQGKGTWLSLVAANVTNGVYGPKRNVVWIGSEDSNAIDIHPRIAAAGGDPSRVFVVAKGHIQLPQHVDLIKDAIAEFGDVGMVVIDPVSNHTGGRDSNTEEIRLAIAPLNEIADDCQCMVFGVRHLTEKECSRGVLAAILGSSAWVQVPRAVLAIASDDEDPELRHVQCVAGNRLPPGTHGRTFRIDGVMVEGLPNEVTRASWVGDSTKDVDDLLQAGRKDPSRSDQAREMILDILEGEGEQESDTLDARVAGATNLSAKTVRNQRVALKDAGLIKSNPEKNDVGTVVCWKVSRSGAPRP